MPKTTASAAEESAAKPAKAKKATAKKAAAKKPAAKKAPAKKAAAKVVKAKAAKPAADKKPARKAASRKANPATKSPLYLGKDEYNAMIEGLMDQGLDREDAIETLKVGIRQANGRPVPPDLLRNEPLSEELSAVH